MDATVHDAPLAVLARVTVAMNRRDLAAFVGCFAPDYASEQPAHPDRRFRGASQVERNWAAMFAALPDFRVDVLRTAAAADSAWVEWRWTGTRADGSRLDACGACIFGVRSGRIAWGRLYMEEIEAGRGIEAAVAELSAGKASGEATRETPAAPTTVDGDTPRPDAT
jgi:ketosteroid isomerase-like protein